MPSKLRQLVAPVDECVLELGFDFTIMPEINNMHQIAEKVLELRHAQHEEDKDGDLVLKAVQVEEMNQIQSVLNNCLLKHVHDSILDISLAGQIVEPCRVKNW